MIKPKLFISHATDDLPLVKSFVHLLESGVGVKPTRIICTSLKGQGIKPGAHFTSSIRQSLDEATTVLALISENFYNSPYCMCELGGTWLQAKNFIPVLVPPCTFSDMKAVLQGLQAIRINDDSDLDELRDEVVERLNLVALATPRWNERRADFLSDLQSNLDKIPQSPTVARTRLEEVETKLADCTKGFSALQKRTNTLQSTVEKLKKAKDSKEVATITLENTGEPEAFSELLRICDSSLAAVHRITYEALFRDQRGDTLSFGLGSEFEWSEAEYSLNYKELKLNADETSVLLEPSNPKVKAADEALASLNSWLENDASSEFFEWYASENGGYSPDLEDRSFWDRHF